MSDLPRVDIVIPTIGRERLELAIVSALTQTYPNVRPVVLSDGPNAARAMVKPYLGRRGLVFLETPARLGHWGDPLRASWNASAVAAPYIKFLDDDDILRPHCVELMMAPILANPDVKLTYCQLASTVWSGNAILRDRFVGAEFRENDVGNGNILYAREIAATVPYSTGRRSTDWTWIAAITAGLDPKQIVSVPHALYVSDCKHGDNYDRFHREGFA